MNFALRTRATSIGSPCWLRDIIKRNGFVLIRLFWCSECFTAKVIRGFLVLVMDIIVCKDKIVSLYSKVTFLLRGSFLWLRLLLDFCLTLICMSKPLVLRLLTLRNDLVVRHYLSSFGL